MEAGGVIHWANGAAWYRQSSKFVIDDFETTPSGSRAGAYAGAYAGAGAPAAAAFGGEATPVTSGGGTWAAADQGEQAGGATAPLVHHVPVIGRRRVGR